MAHAPRIPAGREDVPFQVVVPLAHVAHHHVVLPHAGCVLRYHVRDEDRRIPGVRLPRLVDPVHGHHERPFPIALLVADSDHRQMIEVACGARYVPPCRDGHPVHRLDQNRRHVHVDSILSNFGVLPGFPDGLVDCHPFHDFPQPGPQLRVQPRKQVRTPV